ncbi:hypothetical protein BT93_G0530 [Corymbia citriodora subsp. variegata]|nr:hypothetical protein BT93_G0530 [Corymbia citriodora subsp. variegata]
MVRGTDGKSPREAIEFVLQLLKYNDNNGNIYSDVFWLATLVQSIGELEFGQQVWLSCLAIYSDLYLICTLVLSWYLISSL